MKWLHLLDKVLKCVYRFRVDMSIIKCFCRGLQVTETAARGDTIKRQIQDLGGHVHYLLAAEGKRVHLLSKGPSTIKGSVYYQS